MFTVAISPCPNDTFAFYALLHGKTSWRKPVEIIYADIERLNRLCFAGQVDICKISFGAWMTARPRYCLLETGSALGFGCGPLVVARRPMPVSALRHRTIAIPGYHTTATLLLRLLLGADVSLVEKPFHQILLAVQRGEVDAGLIIHESRFTYQRLGLVSLIDLGDWWERESGHAIPLGGIVASRQLPEEEVLAFERALGESIDYAWAHRDEVWPFMQRHAQEMEREVMESHVALYVNQFTRELGPQGRAAIAHLEAEASRLERATEF